MPYSSFYLEYLKSPEWANKRKEYLSKNNNDPRCYCCDTVHLISKPLELHHLTYARLGKERDSDLVLVCHECHDMIHTFRVGNMSIYAATEKTRDLRQRTKKKLSAPTTENIRKSSKNITQRGGLRMKTIHPGARGIKFPRPSIPKKTKSDGKIKLSRYESKETCFQKNKLKWFSTLPEEYKGPKLGLPILHLNKKSDISAD